MSSVTGKPIEDVNGRLSSLIPLAGTPALVLIDVQNDFGNPDVIRNYGLVEADLARVEAAVDTMEELVTKARENNVLVVWVELGSDPDDPWKASNWLRTGDYDSPMDANEPCIINSEGADWYRVTPIEGEPRIVKPTYSGFVRTDLDDVLHELNASWLTVVGLTTECCVFATSQDAMQNNWRVVVPVDGVTAYDPAVNEAALRTLAINIAAISDSDTVTRLWEEWAS